MNKTDLPAPLIPVILSGGAGTRLWPVSRRAHPKPFMELAMKEARFAMLARTNADHAEHLFALAQKDIDDQWHYYEQMAGVERAIFDELDETGT